MPWRFWAKGDPKSAEDKNESSSLLPPPINTSRNASTKFTPTQTITISLLTTATALIGLRIYKTHLRRIPSIAHLKPTELRQRTLYGYVTRVGDGDNFHLFHTPGGRLAGWGWLRSISQSGKDLKGKTLHVRLAGIDAPEMAHFGRPEQPFAKEALSWLHTTLLHRYVRVRPWRRDQYERVVCTVYKRRFVFFKSDVGLEMIRKGLATVYEAKFGSEFGGKEEQYRNAEEVAKRRKSGMWQKPGLIGRMMGRKESSESPREYKNRMAGEDKGKGK